MNAFGFYEVCNSVFLDSFLDEQNNLYSQSYYSYDKKKYVFCPAVARYS